MQEHKVHPPAIHAHPYEERIRLRTPPGINRDVVEAISHFKGEPEWMLAHRLQCLEIFEKIPTPAWGPDLSNLDLNAITYFIQPPADRNSRTWEEVPPEIRETFERLGIPQAEREALSGVGAQYESEVVYHNMKKTLEDQGVTFMDCDLALKKHEELFHKHFMKVVPPNLHKFSALHGAVWSGGTFLHVPKGVKIDLPLQAYFRMNALKMGQFEHTLIIAEEGAQVHYIEGCSAPMYLGQNSLHAGCVEIHAKRKSRVRYSSVENWSKNTYNLNTKRAHIYEGATMEWVGGNLGAGVTMLYPSSVLVERNARADHISVAYAGKGQNQDIGAKIYHIAPNTKSVVKSKSISKEGGITTYRGMLHVSKEAHNCMASVTCDGLIMDAESKSNTHPVMNVQNENVDIAHEATVGRISNEQLFYLMSRGLSKEQAIQMIVSGFIEPVVKELPLEYAVELNRIISMEMEGKVG
ncbi:Uncharacterised protein [uncultured archaeon]|nr:Uncharacterised protein [uncultured archaeon]